MSTPIFFDPNKPIQSKKTTMDFFDCSDGFIHHTLIKKGMLTPVKVSGKLYFRTDEILKLAEGQPEGAVSNE